MEVLGFASTYMQGLRLAQPPQGIAEHLMRLLENQHLMPSSVLQPLTPKMGTKDPFTHSGTFLESLTRLRVK